MAIDIINAFTCKASAFNVSYLDMGLIPFPRLIKYLKNSTIQVQFGLAKNVEREQLLQFVIKESYHWLAFSKAIPKEVVQKVNTALYDLKNSGELKRIYESYGEMP